MSEVRVTKKANEPAQMLAPFFDGGGWNMSPFSLMRRFSSELEQMWGRHGDNWTPVVEVEQAAGILKVRAELPGMKEQDIKVEATPNGLLIEGERQEKHEEKRDGYFRSERSYGKFYRLLPLPEGAEIDKAKAVYATGVLEVTVPVPAPVKAEKRQIPVETKAAA